MIDGKECVLTSGLIESLGIQTTATQNPHPHHQCLGSPQARKKRMGNARSDGYAYMSQLRHNPPAKEDGEKTQ